MSSLGIALKFQVLQKQPRPVSMQLQATPTIPYDAHLLRKVRGRSLVTTVNSEVGEVMSVGRFLSRGVRWDAFRNKVTTLV